MNIKKLILGVLILALSGLLMADGITTILDAPILFEGVDGGFKILVGFVFILLTSLIIEDADAQ